MIILLAGNKESGKDTVNSYICDKWSFSTEKFAKPIKEMTLIMFPDWNKRYTEGDLKEVVDERYGISPRQVMQTIGDEYGQQVLCNKFPEYSEKVGRKIWSMHLLDRVKNSSNSNFVVSDNRYMHEAEYIRNNYEGVTVVVRIIRNENLRYDSHRSEAEVALIEPDYYIKNDSSKDILYRKVDKIMREIFS